MVYRYMVSVLCIVLLACGGSGGGSESKPDPAPDPPTDKIHFPEQTLWGSQVSYRKFDTADKSEVLKVAHNALDSVC